MKILLTVHQFFPEFASGTEVLTRSVALELISRGYHVHVLTGYPNEQAMSDEKCFDEYDYKGIHVYRFHHAYSSMADQTSSVGLNYDNRLATAYFARIIEKFKPDIVHIFHLSGLGGGLIEHAVKAHIPVYMTPTDFWAVCATAQLMLCDGTMCRGPNAYAGNCVKHYAEKSQKWGVSQIAKWLPTAGADLFVRMTRAGLMPRYPYRDDVLAMSGRLGVNIARLNLLHGIFSPSRIITDVLVRHGVSPKLITHSAFGVDLPGSGPSEPRQPPRQPLHIGFIGALSHHKGCHVLIKAFKALPPGQAILKIYGNADSYPEYSRGLKLLTGDSSAIEFCGVFDNSKIVEVMADLDVLVVPSLWYENTPLVLYSAQAARCPVVASNFPGLSEVIRDEENGLLFEARNDAALTKQLLRLINEQGLALRLSANARQPKSTAIYVDELLDNWNVV